MSSRRLEKNLNREGYSIVAGIDEVGRGALAGPLVSACVVLPERFDLKLADSKSLSAKRRIFLADKILSHCIDFGIGLVNNHEIDQLKITEAIRLSYIRSLENLDVCISRLVIDGNYDYLRDYQFSQVLVRADQICSVVSAASIIAKVFRDSLMIGADNIVKGFFFKDNVGYGTKAHLSAITSYGITELHRRSFKIKGII